MNQPARDGKEAGRLLCIACGQSVVWLQGLKLRSMLPGLALKESPPSQEVPLHLLKRRKP